MAEIVNIGFWIRVTPFQTIGECRFSNQYIMSQIGSPTSHFRNVALLDIISIMHSIQQLYVYTALHSALVGWPE